MMFRFACYRVRPDADLDAFRAFEARVGEDYAAGCRTFGFHSLGTYEIVGTAARSGDCTHVDVYVVAGTDHEAAERRADEAPDPPGYGEIVDECRSFMAEQHDRCSFWLIGRADLPTTDLPLGPRALVVDLAPTGPGDAGSYDVEWLADASRASVSIADSDAASAPSDGWLLRPVVMGAAVLPALD